MKPGIVRLVNEGHVFSVSQSKAPSVYPQRGIDGYGRSTCHVGQEISC